MNILICLLLHTITYLTDYCSFALHSGKMANSILRRKIYHDPHKPQEELRFSTVLVDPPRAGLDTTTLELVGRYETIIYISCNPVALVRDLQTLQKTHRILKGAAFDHFPHTKHLEMGVILTLK